MPFLLSVISGISLFTSLSQQIGLNLSECTSYFTLSSKKWLQSLWSMAFLALVSYFT